MELVVFNVAFEAAIDNFNLTRNFPKEEKYFYPVNYFSE